MKFIFFLLLFFAASCSQKDSHLRDNGNITLVFKQGKIGDPEPIKKLLEKFEQENPGTKVKEETLPASTDEQHQFYAINLESKSSDFDVFSMDVIWVPEFARAGWLRNLNHLMPEEEKEKFFPGPRQAVQFNNNIYAIPWYIDAGLIYYRKDLLEKYGFGPPKTWPELLHIAQYISPREKGIYGYIWQGKQYEGLVCNVLEYFWGNGGRIIKDGQVAIASPENVFALQFMRDMITRYKITPALVTTAMEETTRYIFGNSRALFMRNWPYAWKLFEKNGSLVKGKVGICPLPSFPGKDSASTLGGWQLGINRFTKHPKEAEKLLRFLTSASAQKFLSLAIGYQPARKSLYQDEELIKNQPFLVSLYGIFEKARPRPVTPYYMMISQVMQPEFSAALLGIKKPAEALASTQRQIIHILGMEK